MKGLNSDLNLLNTLIRLGNIFYGACPNLLEAEFEKQNQTLTEIY
jgi:hypothetical protein